MQRERDERMKARQEAERFRRERRESDRGSVRKMQQSVEVMKWCLLSICAVWVLSFMIAIGVLFKVRHEISMIEDQVDRIRYRLEHPFASVGERWGGTLDKKLKEMLNISDESGSTE